MTKEQAEKILKDVQENPGSHPYKLVVQAIQVLAKIGPV